GRGRRTQQACAPTNTRRRHCGYFSPRYPPPATRYFQHDHFDPGRPHRDHSASRGDRVERPGLRGERAGDDGGEVTRAGCNRKTAERLIVELKAKVGSLAETSPASASAGETVPGAGGVQRDAVAALIALGYRGADADQAIRHATLTLGPKATTEALVKKALSG